MRQSRLNNRALLDKARFTCLEKEKKIWLQGLSMKKAIALEEILLATPLADAKYRFPDYPVCLKNLLGKKT
ncbi:MAG: hypothetical protein FJZ13_03505 [Candidatus Omnitrophica bacterium]|nr:hypothetical protein [Candidatus Omnitrophota bacterium]